jgi:hypothetical protein
MTVREFSCAQPRSTPHEVDAAARASRHVESEGDIELYLSERLAMCPRCRLGLQASVRGGPHTFSLVVPSAQAALRAELSLQAVT